MMEIPKFRVDRKDGKVMVLGVWDEKYFDDPKNRPVHNLRSAYIIPNGLGGFQVHMKLEHPVVVPFQEDMRHGHMTVDGVPVQVHSPRAITALHVRYCDFSRVGQLIEKLVCERSVLERIRADIEQTERMLGWKP